MECILICDKQKEDPSMKKTMTRLLAVLLVACTLCAFLVPGAMAADDTATIQKALVETAKAYWYKGAAVQYDSSQMTHQTRLSHGESRICSGTAPEWAADDETLFSVCSDFVFNVYYDATGYEVMGGSRNAITRIMAQDLDPNEPTLVAYYGGKSSTPIENFRESLALLQPGDIITYYRSTKSGHATMYVGDIDGDGKGDIMHCNGAKMDIFETGRDNVDNQPGGKGGAIRVDSAESLLYGEKPLDNPDVFTGFTVMRPTKLGLTLTPAAKARLQYVGIGVDRYTNLRQYNSTKTGDDITVTVTVQNHGTAAFSGVTVKEPLPVGATVKADSVTGGGKVTSTGIEWTVSVPAGGKTEVSYKATVTAPQGKDVTFPSGTVTDLTTRPMTYKVGGENWTKANLNTFAYLRKGSFNDHLAKLKYEGDLGFANAFYKTFFGLELGLPNTIQELVDNSFTPTKLAGVGADYWNDQMLIPKKLGDLNAAGQKVKTMSIPEHTAGFCVYLRESLTEVPKMMGAVNRTMEIREEFYTPGDIFFGYKHKNRESFTVYKPDVYIYLGSNKVVGFTAGGKVNIDTFSDTAALMLRHDVMFALRPSLGVKDVNNTAAAASSFTDVKAGDWFFNYVQDLVANGTVNGMNATTFAPGGNLTYGQALKLVALAVGEKEQAATTSHWASGYLKLAQEKGWVAGDVALDKNITRLQFCQIAAKAKGLTQQPENKPFLDCTDEAVLAMNKAGIINGMTKTMFKPDELLTRAQISKIIWVMGWV